MRQGSCEYEVYVRDTRWEEMEKHRGQDFQAYYIKRKCRHAGTVAVGVFPDYRYYCGQHAKMLEGVTKSEG